MSLSGAYYDFISHILKLSRNASRCRWLKPWKINLRLPSGMPWLVTYRAPPWLMLGGIPPSITVWVTFLWYKLHILHEPVRVSHPFAMSYVFENINVLNHCFGFFSILLFLRLFCNCMNVAIKSFELTGIEYLDSIFSLFLEAQCISIAFVNVLTPIRRAIFTWANPALLHWRIKCTHTTMCGIFLTVMVI